MRKPTGRFPLAASVILLVVSARSVFVASPPDRTALAQQTTVDPATGELLAGPATYVNLGSPDRSALAQQMTVDPSTGELTAVPGAYANLGSADRSAFAQQTTVDLTTGELLADPATYANLGSKDRSALVQQTTVDLSTGEETAQPGGYVNVGAPDRTTFAQQTSVTPATGEQTGQPNSYPVGSQNPVPDGSFGTPMRAFNSGSTIQLSWDATTCASSDYHLLYGNLASIESYTIGGSVCGLGTSGTAVWGGAPGGTIWFVIVGNDEAGTEGTWGTRSGGADRAGTTPSNQCGNTLRRNTAACQ